VLPHEEFPVTEEEEERNHPSIIKNGAKPVDLNVSSFFLESLYMFLAVIYVKKTIYIKMYKKMFFPDEASYFFSGISVSLFEGSGTKWHLKNGVFTSSLIFLICFISLGHSLCYFELY
jgi:hypothetical protein